jgi:hypothetical protein
MIFSTCLCKYLKYIDNFRCVIKMSCLKNDVYHQNMALDLILRTFMNSKEFNEMPQKNWDAVARLIPGTTPRQVSQLSYKLCLGSIVNNTLDWHWQAKTNHWNLNKLKPRHKYNTSRLQSVLTCYFIVFSNVCKKGRHQPKGFLFILPEFRILVKPKPWSVL